MQVFLYYFYKILHLSAHIWGAIAFSDHLRGDGALLATAVKFRHFLSQLSFFVKYYHN